MHTKSQNKQAKLFKAGGPLVPSDFLSGCDAATVPINDSATVSFCSKLCEWLSGGIGDSTSEITHGTTLFTVSCILFCGTHQLLLRIYVVEDVYGQQGVKPQTCAFSPKSVPSQL
ncbi:hypothetical protein DY000_02040079 [Brassica cretica]|uniref:Uncharacterized protein n=1 Tax=Brassica cretica TaxID=69181 RepID=A0ABQ7BAQ4_BRACR|nr:hypothetical protein DY000_02040079 [Brassica cretica]